MWPGTWILNIFCVEHSWFSFRSCYCLLGIRVYFLLKYLLGKLDWSSTQSFLFLFPGSTTPGSSGSTTPGSPGSVTPGFRYLQCMFPCNSVLAGFSFLGLYGFCPLTVSTRFCYCGLVPFPCWLFSFSATSQGLVLHSFLLCPAFWHPQHLIVSFLSFGFLWLVLD